MRGGEIFGNNVTGDYGTGGGVHLRTYSSFEYGTFQIVTGTIYGNTEPDTSLRNTANYGGAALFNDNNGKAQRGTFSGAGDAWVSSGDLDSPNDNTIRVVNGDLIQ